MTVARAMSADSSSTDDWFSAPLIGLDEAQRQLSEAHARGRLPGAYLFSGAEGIGKATLALRLSAVLLGAGAASEEEGVGLFGDALPSVLVGTLTVDSVSPILTRMVQESHPDFLWIRRPYDEKKQQYKSEIPVERIRAIGERMALTAGEGGWKVILIDPAEAMNHNAANALLKWLEEPPPRSLFLLVSHAPGRLLPTIRSRCRALSITAPSREAFDALLRPEEPDATRRAQLYRLSGGSPGLARSMARTAWHKHWSTLLECATTPSAPPELLRRAETMAKDAGLTLRLMQRLMESLLRRVCALHSATPMDALSDTPEEAAALQAMAARLPLEGWLSLWDQQRASIEDAGRLHLDTKQVYVNLLAGYSSERSI